MGAPSWEEAQGGLALVLPDAHVGVADVAHNLVLQVLPRVGDLVQRQPVRWAA